LAHPEDAQRLLNAGLMESVAPSDSRPMSESAPSVSTAISTRRAAITFLFALAGCTLAYLVFAVQGKWFSSIPDRFFGANTLVMARGSAVREGDELVIAHEGPGGDTIVSVVTDLRSADYPVIAWVAIDVPESAQVALLWHSDYEPAQMRKLPVRVVSGRLLPVSVVTDPHWVGRIGGLALAIHGGLTQPIRLRGVIAKPADAKETVVDRVREWIALEPWTGASINTVTGGADVQDLPLPLLLVAAVAIGAGALIWSFRRRLHVIAPSLAIVIGAMFVVAWFVLDARWTFNLIREARESALRYGGKDWRGKHLAAEDGPLFEFIEKARKLMPAATARVFVLADAHYYRGRAAFHLYPHNVWYDPYSNTVPPVDRLRTGDYIVVYQRKGVQYDAAGQRLRWDGGAVVPVELKLVDGGGALFVVQ
jgi:hypothetical protein